MSSFEGLAKRVSVAGRIRKHAGKVDLFLVEDLHGWPMAYTQSDSLARLYFAAPGMLNLMERMAIFCDHVAMTDGDPDIALEAWELLSEVKLVIQSAADIKIDQANPTGELCGEGDQQ
ncbi:MAG: hypothetical protein HQM06_16130 [Magnetococcales bacterium]|nr:hypothetical protein [Magnetococcales bacterium]